MPYSDLLRGRASIGWQIYLVTTTLAYVVMPDHLHWLLQLHPRRNLSAVVQSVKGSSALQINRVRRTRGPVWEVGFHDHGLRREEDLQNVARYVVANPLRAGLVRRINDYSLWDAVWVGESG